MCLLLLCGMSLLMLTAVNAVPAKQLVGFNKAPLPAESWQLTSGQSAYVVIREKQLWLAPSADAPTSLTYHYYPLRSDSSRYAFGDFTAALHFITTTASAPLRFGLLEGTRWQLWAEWRQQPSAAVRLVRICAGQRQATAWKPVTLPGTPDSLRFTRQGQTVVAELAAGDTDMRIGQWRGDFPSIVDFGIAVLPRGGEVGVRQLAITPLPAASATSNVLPRHGTPLTADTTPVYDLADGEANAGYLWSPTEKPTFMVRVTNLKHAENHVLLKTWMTDWQDAKVGQHTLDLRLHAAEVREVPVALPANRYGFFHFFRQLTDTHGVPLEALASTDYAITDAPSPAEIPESSSFGIHARPFARIGAKYVRFWDNGVGLWSGIETEKGKWDWSALDRYIGWTQAAKIEPLVVLAGTPAWATSDPSYESYIGRGAFSPPTNLADWEEYCRQMARRYKGKVHYYEVWNEPNNNGIAPKGFFFYGTPEQYFAILQTAYRAVKAEDPTAKILAPSGTGDFFPFLKRIVDLGGLNYFDILSVHCYCSPFPAEIGYQFSDEKSYSHRIETARDIMHAGGQVKPIWNTEFGYLWCGPTTVGVPQRPDQIAAEALADKWPNWAPGWPYRPQDQRRAAEFVPRYMMESLALGVERTFYHHGLVWQLQGVPAMTAASYGWASRLLSSAHYDQSFTWAKDMAAHGFMLGDGRYLLAYWRVEPETLTMDAKTDATLGKVESAPVLSGQLGISGLQHAAPRATYFDPARKVPTALRLNVAPAECYDLWGNRFPRTVLLPIDDAPRYVIFAKKPAKLTATVTVSTPPSAMPIVPAPDAGTVTD
jgi:hypothetical protein